MDLKPKGGRPTDYTAAIGEEICNAIASSSKGIKRLCNEREHWPCADTIFHWRRINREFSDQYAQAKEAQIEALIEEILEIADDTTNDNIIKLDGVGNTRVVCNSEWINRSRLRIDTRKWLAAKLCPRLYGEKPREASLEFDNSLTSLSVEQKVKLFCSIPIEKRLELMQELLNRR